MGGVFMRLSGVLIFGQQNSLINVERVNQSVSKQPHSSKGSHMIQMQRDRMTISPQGKISSVIDSLNKQKENILERREQFIQQACTQGQSDEMMKPQLEEFDQQLREIDKQIQEAALKRMTDDSGKSAAKIHSNQQKTKQDIQNEILSNITAASTNLDQVETIHTEKNKLDGDTGVLKSEIELDKARDTTGSGAEAIAKKENLLAEMQSRSLGLLQDIGEGLQETNEVLEENTELSLTKPTEEQKDSDKIDTKPSNEAVTSGIQTLLHNHGVEEVTLRKDNLSEVQD